MLYSDTYKPEYFDLFSYDGTAVYTATAPDTITTWVTSAFAVNQKSGLALASELANVSITVCVVQIILSW